MMFFHKAVGVEDVLRFIRPKLQAMLNNAKYGVDVEIKEHTKTRTTDQNRYLWAIYKNIVEFWNATGFIPDGLQLRFITSDFLHEYFKARFDLKTTTKMSTAEFTKYTDGIQQLMIEQTKGAYEPIYPENTFQELY